MNKFINPQIAEMQQYKPPLDGRTNFPGVLLDFNESTIGPSPKVLQTLNEFIKSGKLNIYPEYFDVNKIVADYAQVNADEVMMTNGSDEGIDLIFRTFTGKGDKVIIPAPSFILFDQFAQIAGNQILQPVYSKDDLSFPLQEVLQLSDEEVKLIVICNPNNPTGTLVSLEDMKKVLEKAPNAIVMVDEAYFEFSQLTAANLINEYKNLIITRTFSKAFGLAGLRIGYLLSCEENIKELLKVRSPYDVNIMAYYGLKTALADLDYMKNYVNEVMNEAKPLLEEFFKQKRIKFFPSASNFVLFKPDDAQALVEKMKKGGFLLRPRNGANIQGTVRVSVGTVKQMQKFIEVFNQ